MKVVIEIPKEFERDYSKDKFDSYFNMVLSDMYANRLSSEHDKTITAMFIEAFMESKVE